MSDCLNNEQRYCVYVHINKSNHKKYVGITCKKPEERWKNDGYGYRHQAFYEAIQKYGWNNFDHIVLETNLTVEEANQKEKEYIKLYDSYKNGYNCSYGGDGTNGYVWSEKSKKKMVETRIRNGSFKGKNNPAYGKSPKERLSEEAYNKWRESHKGKFNSPTKKIICLNTGEVFSRVGIAAERFNIKSQSITDSICRKNAVKIQLDKYWLYYVFDYYEENKQYNLIDYCYKYSPKSVICLETKEVFWGANDAARIMNTTGCAISRVCRHLRKANNGYHYMYVKEYVERKSDGKNIN